MKNIFTLSALFVSIFSFAHPGIGIVKDSKGNIFYTDLKQVWKISKDGKKTVAVSGVHTHELYIDQQDNVYGEHLWYNGERLNTWGYYVWCLKNSGELVKIIEPSEGFRTDYSFTRDAAGNMYWVERFTTSRIMKKSEDGTISRVAEGKFGFIGWLYATDNGTLYFTESNKLRKLSPTGEISTIAENLLSKTTDFSVMGRNYDSYGIWTDKENNIYLAMIDTKKVNRISPDGKVTTLLHSGSLWTVCSGLFDDEGNLWVLENSITNEVRARKLSQEELNNQVPGKNRFTGQTHLLITLITGAAIILNFLFLAFLIKRKKRNQNLNLAV
jgi:hypothetical protein